MKIASKQESAVAFSNALNRLNEAQIGQIQVTYADEQGNKRSGYLDLMDLKIEVDNKEMAFGTFLTDLVNFNVETLKLVKKLASGVASIKTDLIAVRNDELGFIKQVLNFNQSSDFVIASQYVPNDVSRGYYYIKDGKITLSETRKLELFPDFV